LGTVYRPPLVRIMNQENPVHIITFHLSESNVNIILPSTIRSHKLSLSLRYGYLICTMRPNTCSSHVSLYVHPNDILWRVQIMKFLVWFSLQLPVTSVRPYLLTYLLTYAAEPFLRSRQLCSQWRNSQHFMEPKGSSPCSQEPSTGPYSEPDRSSPHHPIVSKIYFNIVHLPTGLPSGLFPTSILYAFFFCPFVLHALPISSSLT
jgi:hypothetical protein